MADDDEDGLSPVDQGTVFMLCLSLGLAVLAAFWFACKWYKKRHKPVEKRITRPRLKQTFSRFSQVDEELTMHHMSEYDNEILQAYSAQELKTSAGHVQTQTTSPVTKARMTSIAEKKPYLETDI